MKSRINVENLLMWKFEDHGLVVMTAEIKKERDGFVSTWVVSSNYGGTLQVQSIFECPIYGATEQDARQRAGFIKDDVVKLLKKVFDGSGSVMLRGSKSDKEVIALMHLAGHWEKMSSGLGVIERTAVVYKFLKQFGVSNVAQVITELEGVKSVRTVHERIFLAKQKRFI